jgi:hypothetical protein
MRAVVPAKAGTHNHRPQLLKQSRRPLFSSNIRRGVWVPACAGTTWGEGMRSRSRGMFRPSFSKFVAPLQTEGAGNVGCALHPRSRVQYAQRKGAHEHTGERRTLRHPLRNGVTAYFVLSPVSGLVVTVIGGTLSANLTPASRRQDHTTWPYALAQPSAEQRRPSQSRPYVFVAIAKRPSGGPGVRDSCQ